VPFSLADIMPRLIAVAIMLLVAFPIHEFSHALAALRLGDRTAQYMGRLTLDPRVHFDPLGGGLLALGALIGGFFIGWAKPTPYNPVNLQGGRRGEAIVAVAGPISNLAMAILVALPLRVILASEELRFGVLSTDQGTFVLEVAANFILINLLLFVFNLLPIPVIGLDGWKVLLGLVDVRTAYRLRALEVQYQQFVLIGLLLLLFFGGRVIGPVVTGIFRFLVGI
jgi:Zn-dependent protease